MACSSSSTKTESDLKCNLCCEGVKNVAHTDCFHQFCLKCIQSWVTLNGPKCPVCDKTYDKIYYDVKKLNDFKVINLGQSASQRMESSHNMHSGDDSSTQRNQRKMNNEVEVIDMLPPRRFRPEQRNPSNRTNDVEILEILPPKKFRQHEIYEISEDEDS